VAVFDEPQLTDVAGKFAVPGWLLERVCLGGVQSTTVDLVGEVTVGVAHDEGTGIHLIEYCGEVGEPSGGEAQVDRDLAERRARAGPEFADLGVGVELVGVPAGGLAEVQSRL